MGKRSTGGIAVAIAIMAVAQRLANYENKPLAIVLAVGAGIFLLWFTGLWAKDVLRLSLMGNREWMLERTPDGLRRCVSVLAGDLYAVLVESGKDNNRPESDDLSIVIAATEKDKAAEKLLRSLPIPIYTEDHSLMKRITELRFDDRLRQIAGYARELGLWNEPNPLSVMFPKSPIDKTLPELLTVDPKNADDVKHRIDGLRALARIIRGRFPPSRGL
jgi:hypothetical protein